MPARQARRLHSSYTFRMTRLTAQDFQPEVLQLFDRYVHGDLSRRGFLESAVRYAGSAAGAAGLLAALSPQFAQAQQVAPGDARIQTRYLDIDSPHGYGRLHGYLAKPAGSSARLPAVLVVHENRGLNPHIEDIARRLALDGFLAFAPDALTPLGGYPGDEHKARDLFAKLDAAKTRADFVAAERWLQASAEANGHVGVVGFCWGGGMANYLATQLPEVRAAVPFYGAQPAAQDVPKIKAAGTRFEAYTYAVVQHGFNNDTTPRFDAEAGRLARQRTVTFFKTQLA